MADERIRVRIEADGSQAGRELQQSRRGFSSWASVIRRGALAVAGTLASLTAAFVALRKEATLQDQTEAVRRNLAAQGIAFDEYIEDLRRVADAQIATADLIKLTGEALALGIPAEEISRLLEVARASAIQFGKDFSTAFRELVEGVGRGSAEILNNLGIIVRADDAYRNLAEGLGVTTEQLTAQQRQQAILQEVLRVGAGRVELYGDAQNELSRRISQSTAAVSNLQRVLGQLASAGLLASVAAVAQVAKFFVDLGTAAGEAELALLRFQNRLGLFSGDFAAYERALLVAINRQRQLSDSIEVSRLNFAEYAQALVAVVQGAENLGDSYEPLPELFGRFSDATIESKNALEGLNGELPEASDGIDDVATSTNAATDSFEAYRRALQASRIESERARAESERLEEQQQATAAATQRTSSILSSQGFTLGGTPLFPGLSGNVYTYQVQRNGRLLPNGRVVPN